MSRGRLRTALAALALAMSAPLAAANAPAAPIPSADALMNWAETAYPQYFPGHPPTQRSLVPWLYRSYVATGNYVGVSGSGVYIAGPVAGGGTLPLYVGELSDFACQVTPAPCGTKTVQRLPIDGLEREFIVYVPWRAQSGAARVPVVVVLHGTSGDGVRFFDTSGWREKADAEGIIAVFPTALVHCFREDENADGVIADTERSVTTKWAAGSLGDPARRPLCPADEIAGLPANKRALADHPLADDMAFIGAMLDHLGSRYPADMKRVYATGFSNGGEMSGRLATQMSDRLAAVAVAAASLNTVSAVPAQRKLSVTWSTGSLDPAVAAYLGYPRGLPLDASLGASATYQSRVAAPWTTVLGLAPTYTWSGPMAFGTQLSRFVYADSATTAGNRFSALVIDGADHQYPNGTNHPVRMAELLWEFFKTEALP